MDQNIKFRFYMPFSFKIEVTYVDPILDNSVTM